MGAYSILNDKKIKFWKVDNISLDTFNKISNNFNHINFNDASYGEILLADEKGGLFIKAIDGIISVLEIQGENAKRMTIDNYLRGNKLEMKSIFK